MKKIIFTLLLLFFFLPSVSASLPESALDQMFDRLEQQMTNLERNLKLSREELTSLKLDLATLEAWCQMVLEVSAELSSEYQDKLMMLSNRQAILEQRLASSEKQLKNWKKASYILGGLVIGSLAINVIQGVSR